MANVNPLTKFDTTILIGNPEVDEKLNPAAILNFHRGLFWASDNTHIFNMKQLTMCKSVKN